jgi:hypothetical protein
VETIEVTLSASLMAFLRERAKKLGFVTLGDYVVFLLEELERRETERKKIEAKQGARGTAIVAFYDEIVKLPKRKN